DCRARVASASRLRTDVQTIHARLNAEAARSSHLTYEDVVGRVEGHLDAADRRRLDAHLRECETCSADVRGIEEVRNELEANRAEDAAPTADDRVRTGWRWFWRPARVLVPAVALGGLVLFVVLRGPSARGPTQTARSQPAQPSAPPAADS